MNVNDLGAPGTGPAQFTDGAPASGITYTFVGLGDVTDDLEFDDGTLTYSYTPTPDAAGLTARQRCPNVDQRGLCHPTSNVLVERFVQKVGHPVQTQLRIR